MGQEDRVTIQVSRRLDTTAERAFDAWFEPEKIRKFLFATPAGQIVRIEVDARPGGHLLVVDRRDGTEIEHHGSYIEIDRPHRFVFDFSVPQFSGEPTRVEIGITPQSDGCEVTLTHSGVYEDYAERTKAGWTGMLDMLAKVLDAPPDNFGGVAAPGAIKFERLLPGPVERVWSYLTDSAKRATWLASGDISLKEGMPVELVFHNASLSSDTEPAPEPMKPLEGRHISRHVVTQVDAPRLLALTWGKGMQGPAEAIFELTPEGDPEGSKVRLSLTHRNLADREAGIDAATGWHAHLDVLAYRLAGKEPPAFWTLFAAIGDAYDQRFPE